MTDKHEHSNLIDNLSTLGQQINRAKFPGTAWTPPIKHRRRLLIRIAKPLTLAAAAVILVAVGISVFTPNKTPTYKNDPVKAHGFFPPGKIDLPVRNISLTASSFDIPDIPALNFTVPEDYTPSPDTPSGGIQLTIPKMSFNYPNERSTENDKDDQNQTPGASSCNSCCGNLAYLVFDCRTGQA